MMGKKTSEGYEEFSRNLEDPLVMMRKREEAVKAKMGAKGMVAVRREEVKKPKKEKKETKETKETKEKKNKKQENNKNNNKNQKKMNKMEKMEKIRRACEISVSKHKFK